MAKIDYTADDGSVVEFLDPAGVQAAVEAAIAALPAVPPVAPDATEIDILRTDGTVAKYTLTLVS